MSDSAIIDLPLAPDGCMPPVAVLCAWFAGLDPMVDIVRLPAFAPGNSIIPGCCALYGISSIEITRADLPQQWTWQGSCGAQITVNNPSGHEVTEFEDIPLHIGELPAEETAMRSSRAAFAALLHLARLSDAQNACDDTVGDSGMWTPLLSCLDTNSSQRPPPVATVQRWQAGTGSLTVWNPLPIERTCTVALDVAGEDLPWSVILPDGRRFPVQVVEGALGRQLLARLPMPANACLHCQAHEDPVSIDHWEVSAAVLDNGRLRVEYDSLGRITRLCRDGQFAQLAGPLLAMQEDDEQDDGTHCSVLEDGPVRGRLHFVRHSAAGELSLTYTLYANDDQLHVTASWHATAAAATDNQAVLQLPSRWAGGAMRWHSGAGQPQLISPLADLQQPKHHLAGCQWLSIGPQPEPQDLSILAISHRHADVQGGLITIPLDGNTRFALTGAGAVGHSRRCLSMSCDGRLARDVDERAAPFLLYEADGLHGEWIRRRSAGAIELTLLETEGRHGRAKLVLPEGVQPEQLLDGNYVPLQAHKEDHTWVLPYAAGAVIIIQWEDLPQP